MNNIPDYIEFSADGSTYILETKHPNNLGRVVKLLNQDKAQDFSCKQVDYPIKKLPGLNIFIVHEGYLNEGLIHIHESFDDQDYKVRKMAEMYAESIKENKIVNRRYKTQWQ